jgi:hypothetical protein
MKKSIAFLGALLFGSVTFAQVTKNDSIKKPSGRKVSAEDMKKFPVDAETTIQIGDQKGKTLEKHKGEQTDIGKSNTYLKFNRTEKHASDASAGAGKTSEVKGTVTQKGRENKILVTGQKQSSNPTSNFKGGAIQKSNVTENEPTTQKKHVSNIKWSGDKKAVDSTATQSTGSTDAFIKIGDIKGEKEGIVSPPTSTKSSDMYLKIGDIKGEK